MRRCGARISATVGFFAALPGRIGDAVSSVASSIGDAFSSAFSYLYGVVSDGISTTVAFFATLPGKILDTLSGAGSFLYDVGVDLLKGLANGIRDTVDAVVDTVKNAVKSAIQGAKDALKIGSPSKVFHQIGEWTGEGFANGMTATVGMVGDAATRMASASLVPVASAVPPGQAALSAFTQPFGASGSTSIGPVSTSRTTAAGGLSGGGSGASVVNNFTINEVGNGQVTAQRILNRMVSDSNVVLG